MRRLLLYSAADYSRVLHQIMDILWKWITHNSYAGMSDILEYSPSMNYNILRSNCELIYSTVLYYTVI